MQQNNHQPRNPNGNCNSEKPNSTLDRRDFLQRSLAASATAAFVGLGAAGCAGTARRASATAALPFQAKPLDTVRVGFVGVGGQGSSHVGNLLRIEGVQLVAVCDIVPEKVQRIQQATVDAGQPKPTGYDRGDFDFIRMCQKEGLDLVYTATPWEWHVPVCVAAMKNGKHAASEVPTAVTLDECWELVETAEKYHKHCVQMENCCYDRAELMILNMVRQNLLGELLHAECGYLHDLRGLKLNRSAGEGVWRTDHSVNRNGDLYPTHGLGPVAQCMNINRGNQFTRLVSMGSQSRGLNLKAAEMFGPDSPQAKLQYLLSDVVTSVIQTAQGQTIIVKHDTDTPRPYSRDILVQGTKGIVRKYPQLRVYLEGVSPNDAWEDGNAYLDKYDHPLWKSIQEKAAGAGHGGMDFIEDYRLIECLRKGEPTDMDVYDAAAWCAVSELSERSIAKGSQPQKFPDFTRGHWKNRQPLGIITG